MARRGKRRRVRFGGPVFAVVALASVVASFFWQEAPSQEDVTPSASPSFIEEGRGNTRIESFNKAKKLLAHVYASHEETFYCGCRYAGSAVDLASCGYEVRKNATRARRLEWEHVVPAENFGRAFVEWRERLRRPWVCR